MDTLEKFSKFCEEKKWESHCIDNFMCADGDLIQACYAKSQKNSYALINPLAKLRTSLEIPFQTTYKKKYVWRAFCSRKYNARTDWWGFNNDMWAIYCTKSSHVGDLCIKFGFGSLIADQAIKSVILGFLSFVDTEGIALFLDPTHISASDISFGVHDAKDHGGIKGVFDLLRKQLALMFKASNIQANVSDWIYHPGSALFCLTIPYEFQQDP